MTRIKILKDVPSEKIKVGQIYWAPKDLINFYLNGDHNANRIQPYLVRILLDLGAAEKIRDISPESKELACGVKDEMKSLLSPANTSDSNLSIRSCVAILTRIFELENT